MSAYTQPCLTRQRTSYTVSPRLPGVYVMTTFDTGESRVDAAAADQRDLQVAMNKGF